MPDPIQIRGIGDGARAVPDPIQIRALGVQPLADVSPGDYSAQRAQTYGVFIGVDRFDDESIPALLYAAADAPAARDTFGAPLFGNQPDESFAAFFTTVDTTLPPRPEAGQITASIPEGGVTEITGSIGNAEPGSIITADKRPTGETGPGVGHS